MTIDRRHFLRIAAAGFALPATAAAVGADLGDDLPRALASPGLLAILGEERIRSIGTSWRERTPNERDAESLVAAIVRRAAPGRAGGAGELRGAAALVRRDFADERTVLVDGWLLSITEVRQCALFSLLAG